MGSRQIIALVFFAVLATTGLLAQPVPPGNLRAVILSPTALRLTWNDDSTTETNYSVGYRVGTSGNFGFFPGGSLPANTTTFDALNLMPGVTYQFLVEARYQGGFRYATPEATVRMPDFLPPSNLTAVIVSPTAVNLRWSDSTTNEDGFFVGYRLESETNFVAFPGGILPPNTTNFVATNLAPGTAYRFLIEAFVGNTAFADSPSISVTTPAFRPPSNVIAVATGPNTVNLRWSDTTTNETGFNIAFRVGTNASNSFYRFPGGNVTNNLTNFTATGLLAGTTYQFAVEAFVGTTTFAASTAATVTTPNAISNRPFASGIVGQPFALTLGASTNGGAPDSFIVTGSLPPGVTFDGTNRIAGTPGIDGVFHSVIAAHYPGGATLTNPLAVRVIYAPGPPVVINTNLTLVLKPEDDGLSKNFSLKNYFRDRDTETAVRFSNSVGAFNVALYATATPATVSNFLGYVDRGDYRNSIIHRAAPNYVVQGGGFTNVGTNFGLIPTQPSPTNEPGVAHSRGTIAMAKVGGNPNSATDQWFVNLQDNGNQLDDQNGGFTAFGRVLGAGTSVIDAINNLPRNNYPITVVSGTNLSTATFEDVPVDDISAPSTLDHSKLVVTRSITRVETLSFTASMGSDTNLLTATISGTNLVLTRNSTFGGFATVSVQATDLDDNHTTTNFTVVVESAFTSWLSTNSLTGNAALRTADPDGDGLPNAVEFALVGSPTNADAASVYPRAIVPTNASPQHLTMAFNVRKILSGAKVIVEGADQIEATSWSSIWTSDDAVNPQAVKVSSSGGDYWQVTVTDTVAISPAAPSRFLRLRLEVPQ